MYNDEASKKQSSDIAHMFGYRESKDEDVSAMCDQGSHERCKDKNCKCGCHKKTESIEPRDYLIEAARPKFEIGDKVKTHKLISGEPSIHSNKTGIVTSVHNEHNQWHYKVKFAPDDGAGVAYFESELESV